MADGWLDVPYSLKGKKVWVAGHNGMVGAAVVRRLAGEGCTLLTTDRERLDLCDQAAVCRWMMESQPDVVVLAAARVGGILANAQNPAPFFYENMMIAANVLHTAYEAKVEKLLFLGSSCIYPKKAVVPIKEDALLTGALEPTNEAYALAKIGGLKMAQYYRQQYGCDFISAMPCNLYGQGDTYDEQGSHVIPALIMKAHSAKMNGDKELVVWGSGAPLREFLYVDDLADAILFLVQNYSDDAHVNVGYGADIEIKNLVKVVCEVIGFEGKIVFDRSKPDGVYRKVLDTSILSDIGWVPKICLKKGIKKAYEHFLEGC